MYDHTKSKYNNMENFHTYIIFINTWAVYGCIRKLYDNKSIIWNIDEDFNSWEQILQINNDKWVVSKQMADLLAIYKNKYLDNISSDEFEAFVLCKTYIQCIYEENIKRFPLMFSGFTHLKEFLKSIELLYMQKFNINKIKLLFSCVFFEDVYKLPNNDVFDVIHVLSTKFPKIDMKIKLKRLQTYQEYINKYKLQNFNDIAVFSAISKFKSGEIISIPTFYTMCNAFYEKSVTTKTIKQLKNLFANNEDIKLMINSLNKLYANILLLVLLKQKEDSTTYHNLLYSDLQKICS
ncbi:hypothetical protein QKT26_gp72 [Carcinus maenas nudivirus]|uniref:Uncharacterized protein n=1 Tax=Carcinus maenas nudivirus TaxID=2880837 RepID=A0AAE9BZ74_9VIRU|nr:hypothetical protein QKT26_gp72 [Carcinus maenas nudivirus]UBZ25662.1 hypothetical protein CmNV_071 [Carcinus maenas nudivirus]